MLQNHSDKDKELILRLKNNDVDAFRDLYLKYWSATFVTAFRILKNRELAEDISQDTFTKLWKNRHTLTSIGSFTSYLHTTTHNLCVDQIRQMKVQNKFLENIYAINNTSSNIWDTIENDELKDKINQGLQKLPNAHREVLIMSREENMTHTEIATIVGISQRTVNTYICMALKSLRAYLIKYIKE